MVVLSWFAVVSVVQASCNGPRGNPDFRPSKLADRPPEKPRIDRCKIPRARRCLVSSHPVASRVARKGRYCLRSGRLLPAPIQQVLDEEGQPLITTSMALYFAL